MSFAFGNAQVKLNQHQENALNLQIQNIQKLFIAQDYRSLANTISPKIVKYVYNSKDSVTIGLKFLFDELKTKGVNMDQVIAGAHSQIFKTKNELQCSVQMTTILKKDTIKTVSEAYLLMVSNDNGKNWCFSLTDGFFRDLLDIHPKLIIPERKLFVYDNGILTNNE